MQLHRRVRSTLIVTALALGVTACDAENPPPGPNKRLPTDVVMVLDGVRIDRRELEDLVAFLAKSNPTSGRNHTMIYILDEHLIPMAFARRDLAPQRRRQRELADGLAKQLGPSAGVDELRQVTAGTNRAEFATGLLRPQVGLPERRWLFDDENTLRVSPVLELPQGFSLVAAADKKPGLTTAHDTVDACLVRFFTHKSKAHDKWIRALKERLGSLAKETKKVHPDYRDAIPTWLKPVTIMRPESP